MLQKLIVIKKYKLYTNKLLKVGNEVLQSSMRK